MKKIGNKSKLHLDIILVEPKIGGNIGAVARLCQNFNINKLILVAPQIDHNNNEARQRAKHSHQYLDEAEICDSLENIRDNYAFLIGTSAKAGRNYNVRRQPSYPWELEEILTVTEGKIGLVFGREDRGLSNEELLSCDFLVNIPVPAKFKVMNISHAVAVVLYEIWKLLFQKEAKLTAEKSSSNLEREILFDTFKEIVEALPYEEHRKPIVNHSFTTMINRSFSTSEEIHSLIGIFKTIKDNLSSDIEE
ncbi:MAG: TrmJ/YjtD family RNA methyltransferase [Candidatus Heimdallarchaeota archaeon]|nr:TrmJ/YjtD family RNA methyltransferase [Candidatus Heimdallarchaeota archaeon]